MTETSATRRDVEKEIALLHERVSALEAKMANGTRVSEGDIGAIKERLKALKTIPPARVRRVWTTDENFQGEVPLDVKLGHAVFFETGAGVVEATILDSELIVSAGEYPFTLILKPDTNYDVVLSVDGWQDEPEPGEVCCKCGRDATEVYVWKANGKREAWCGRQCPSAPKPKPSAAVDGL
jgi:hypothetical protein